MWRVLLYLVLIGVAAWGAVTLANHPETVAITWSGREYSTSLAVGAIAVVGLALAISLLGAIVGGIVRLPGTLGRNRRERRRGRGLQALSRGIVAVGAGDVAAARRYAGEAERLIGPEPLTLLLKAQAAQAAGNREGADAAFRRMAQLPDTRILGLRGLYLEARRRGDVAEARAHAAEASRLAPAIGWANDAVLEGYTADGDWASAIRSVERRTSLGFVDRASSRRQRAVLHAANALALEGANPGQALTAAAEAVRLAPDLAPAAALAGRLLAERGELRRAAKILETAWRATEHPDVAGAYLNLRAGDSAADRVTRAETLAKLSSWAPEARLALARAALDARDLPRAREVLRPLADDRPTARTCYMMAEIERADGGAGRVREWLGRAAAAPRDKAWVADGIVAESWAPVSPVTGQLDAFRWETPPETVGGRGVNVLDFLAPEPGDIEPPAALPPAVLPPLAATVYVEPVATDEPPAVSRPAALPQTGNMPAVAASAEALPAGTVPAEMAPDATTPTPDNPPPAGAVPASPEAPSPSKSVAPPLTRDPSPVIFPVAHAPDDPGADRRAEKRSGGFRLLGS